MSKVIPFSSKADARSFVSAGRRAELNPQASRDDLLAAKLLERMLHVTESLESLQQRLAQS